MKTPNRAKHLWTFIAEIEQNRITDIEYIKDAIVELFGVSDEDLDGHEIVRYYQTQETVPVSMQALAMAVDLVRWVVGIEGDISPAMHLRNDLEFDSLDLPELVMEVENVLGIPIDDDSASSIETVGDLASYIAKQLSQD